MRANQMVQFLSFVLEIPIEEAQRISRVLAEAGLRTKGVGRSLPEITRKESLSLLVAFLVTERVTKAAEEVLPWLEARGLVNQFPRFSLSAPRDSFDESQPEVQHGLAVERQISFARNREGEVTLIDYLLALCSLIEEEVVFAEHLSLEVHHSVQKVVVRDCEFGLLLDAFYITTPERGRIAEQRRKKSALTRVTTINGSALSNIIKHT